jgi:UDP-2,3-diacylglucosamine hydrolase
MRPLAQRGWNPARVSVPFDPRMTTLFVSDLHLDAAEPATIELFLRFLATEARTAAALYVLGDLFEAWVGDDDPDPAKRRVLDALRDCSGSGVACFALHGNRDFLLGRRFERESGVRLIADGTRIELNGESTLVMHGDTLCTDDRSYQRLRRIVRQPLLKWVVRRLPLARRLALARRMRAGSRMHTQAAAPEIMDVNGDAVRAMFRATGVRNVIHGHTHRPAIHELEVDGRPRRRIVLGAWHGHGSVLTWDERGPRLDGWPRD